MIKVSHIFPIGSALFYVLYCTVVPYLYKYAGDFDRFGISTPGDWFLRDSCYVAAALMYAGTCFIKDARLRIMLAFLWLLDSLKEHFDLIVYNNEYSPVSNLIQCGFLIIAICSIVTFLYYERSKS